MSLVIAAESYEVKNASLTAFVINLSGDSSTDFSRIGLKWILEIDVVEGMSFWHHNVRFPRLTRWTDLVGQVMSWSSPYDDETGELEGGWYGAGLLGGNSPLLESTLRLAECSGCKIRTHWSGFVSTEPVGGQLDPDEQLPFCIDCWCVFKGVGILCQCVDGEFAKRQLVAQLLNIEDFAPHFDEVHLLRPVC